jgi:hypothetical protein
MLETLQSNTKLTSHLYVHYDLLSSTGGIRYRRQVAVGMAQATSFRQLRSSED